MVINKRDKADIIYLYCNEELGVTSTNNESISDYFDDKYTSTEIYNYIKSIGIDTSPKGGVKRKQGKDCGIFNTGKYAGKVSKEMIKDFVNSGARDLYNYIDNELGNGYTDEEDYDEDEWEPERKSIDRYKPHRDTPYDKYNRPKTSGNKGKSANTYGLKWTTSIIVQLLIIILIIVVIIGVSRNGLGYFSRVLSSVNFAKVVSLVLLILATKPIIKAKNSGFNLGGKIIILFVLWSSVLYYISNY